MFELPLMRGRMSRRIWASVGAFVASTLGPVVAQERNLPLSAAQVACDQSRLGALLDRFELILPDGPVAGYSGIPALFVSEGRGDVLFRGSEVRNESYPHFPPFPFDPLRALPSSDCLDTTERMLGYQLSVQTEQFLLNPDRPPLDQFLLARIEPQSNPTVVGCRLEDDHHLRLGIGPADRPFEPTVEINNIVQAPAGRPSQGAVTSVSFASRNLRTAGLIERCHDQLTEWDRRTFAMLERMLRPFTTFVANESQLFHDQEVAIFRGADPHRYRVDAYSIGKDATTGRGVAVGRSSYEVVVGWDDRGRWTQGSVRLLPQCAGGETRDCTTYVGAAWLIVYPPHLPDYGLRGNPRGTVYVGRGFSGLLDSAPVDWAELLSGSVWNRGDAPR